MLISSKPNPAGVMPKRPSMIAARCAVARNAVTVAAPGQALVLRVPLDAVAVAGVGLAAAADGLVERVEHLALRPRPRAIVIALLPAAAGMPP